MDANVAPTPDTYPSATLTGDAMPQETLVPSPYVFVASRTYATREGAMVRLVFDSLQAKTYRLPDYLGNLLADFERLSGQASDADMKLLSSKGLVCSDPQRLREEAYQRMEAAASDEGSRVFVLLPTSFCNMGCEYCGQVHTRGTLSRNHRDAISHRITNAIRSDDTRAVSVRWFGGEPLMGFAQITALSDSLIPVADEVGVPYHSSIVTNGALLDSRKLSTLVHRCRVTEFHITIDGPQEIHDLHRPLKSGGASFSRLVNFLATATEEDQYKRVKFVLRTNIDVKNCEYVSRYLDEMASKGFSGRRNVHFSLVPVRPWSNDVSALQIKIKEYAQREVVWIQQMADLGLTQLLMPTATKPMPCQAPNRGAEVVTSAGGVFSCTEHPLVPKHEKESILIPLSTLGATRKRPLGEFDSWPSEVSKGEVPCAQCWMLPVCGGSCPKMWHEGGMPCPSSKFNMDERLSVFASRQGMTAVAP